MAVSYSSWSKRDVFRTLFRFKWRGMALFVAILSATGTGLWFYPPKYSSEARVLVRLGRENMSLDPTVTASSQVSFNSSRDAEMNSVVQALESRSNIEKVLDAIGPGDDTIDISSPLGREKAIQRLTKDIAIYAPKNATVMYLTALDSTPERAQQVVQTLLDICLQEHLRVNRTQGSHGFFGDQVELLKSQLDAASEALRDAKNKFGLVSLEGRRSALQQQITNLDLQMHDTSVALTTSVAKIEALTKKLETIPAPLVQQMVGGVPNNGLSDMRRTLFDLQNREQELLARRTEDHPDIVAIRTQVREAQRILAAEAPRHEQAATALTAVEESHATSLKTRSASLARHRESLNSQLEELNQQELQILDLERQVKLLDANYTRYVTGLEQARIDEALKNEGISNLSVIQPPSFVPKPAVPKRGLTVGLAVAAAFGGALGIMFLSRYLDESIRCVHDVERRLELRVFASLPRVSPPPKCAMPAVSHEQRHAKRQKSEASGRQDDTPSTLALMTDRPSDRKPVAASDDPFHCGIRGLYGQLCCIESRLGGPLRSVGVTSCFRQEGRSTIASHLAAVAGETRQVLLVDATAGRPLVHRAMQSAARPGLTYKDATASHEGPQPLPIVPTAVLPPEKGSAGGACPTTEQTRDLLQSLSHEFELVIVDLSALSTAGALEWAPLLDGILLVVEAERVRWQVATRGLSLLKQAGGCVLGTVINKRPDYIPEWLYRRL